MLTTPDSGPRLVRTEAAIAWLDLGGAATGNVLTRHQMTMLSEAIRAAGADPEISVVAIAPAGEAFCLGRNGKGEAAEARPWDARQKQMGVTLDVYDAIAACPIPVVACVQGNAIGFGAALAGGCDITLAAQGARFALPEIKHAIPATLAMSSLVRKIPEKALAHLIYSGEDISAEEALAIGLVSKVYPAEGFAEHCSAYLSALASRQRLLLETIKRYISKAPQLSPEMASEYAGTLMALVKPSL